MSPRVGIVGASGYSGAVAARLLAGHPGFELAWVTSDKLAGQPVNLHLGVPTRSPLRFEPNASALSLADGCDAVFLATSAEVSAGLAPQLLAAGKRVVDFSGAFRLEADAYPRWYQLEHPAPDHLERAHYGLPELFGAPPRGEPALVANPGCYATAALLALAPLLRAGLVEATGLIVDGKSGISGAGRRGSEEYSFVELHDEVRAYKLLAHQHTPEIARLLQRFAPTARLTFTPHLVPLSRGLFVTAYARPKPGTTSALVAACLAEAYAKTRFVRAVRADEVSLHRVAGTNLALVGATADDDVVVVTSALDNLLKGAAGQAVQNLNLLFGKDDAEGLSHLGRFAP